MALVDAILFAANVPEAAQTLQLIGYKHFINSNNPDQRSELEEKRQYVTARIGQNVTLRGFGRFLIYSAYERSKNPRRMASLTAAGRLRT